MHVSYSLNHSVKSVSEVEGINCKRLLTDWWLGQRNGKRQSQDLSGIWTRGHEYNLAASTTTEPSRCSKSVCPCYKDRTWPWLILDLSPGIHTRCSLNTTTPGFSAIRSVMISSPGNVWPRTNLNHPWNSSYVMSPRSVAMLPSEIYAHRGSNPGQVVSPLSVFYHFLPSLQ